MNKCSCLGFMNVNERIIGINGLNDKRPCQRGVKHAPPCSSSPEDCNTATCARRRFHTQV